MTAKAQPAKAPYAAGSDRSFLRPLIFVVVQFGMLFIASGRATWTGGWLFVGVCSIGVVASWRLVPRELLAARGRAGEGWKRWDKFILPWIMFGPAMVSVVAGLDVRFGWTRAFCLRQQLVACMVVLMGHAVVIWAMRCNRHFEGVVRIQRDRDHAVVTSGPYRYVRHPGYVGMIAFQLAAPFVLGSRAAFVPEALVVLVLLLRTALEDRTLRHELTGYADYAKRVRYRILPLVW